RLSAHRQTDRARLMAGRALTPRRLAFAGGHWAIILVFVVFAAFPFYWMLITTFKETRDLINTAYNPFLFNLPPTLDNLRVLFFQTAYVRWLVNTAIVGGCVVAITLVLAVPAGYSLAWLTGSWGQYLGIGIFLTYLIPPTILFIPFSRVISTLGLQDSYWSLVLVYPSFTVPFCSWLLLGFFKTIPHDIVDAALIDGLSRFGAFVKVVVPLSLSGILTVVIFSFTLVLQEFIYAITFITSSSQYTVGVGVPTFLVRGDVYFWGSLMAACLIASVPIAIVYNLFVDRFVAGFTVGAIK
ncbi:MAG: carbohydrate ABC transporter permease, partial [Stellaceae bacterium]